MANSWWLEKFPYSKRDGEFQTNRVSAIGIVAWFMTIMMILMVSLRLFAKFSTRRPIGIDDAIAVFATVTGAGGTIAITAAVRAGLGNQSSSGDLLAISIIQKSVYASTILYFGTICLAKVSTLVLMIGLCSNRTLSKVIRALIVLVIGWGVAAVLSDAFKCKLPTPWDFTGGHCIIIVALANGIAAVDIVTDCVLVILPFWAFGALQIPLMRKVMVIMAFSCRFVVIIVAGCRLAFLNLEEHEPGSFLMQTPYHICTQIQQSLSVIVASVPAIRMFFERAPSASILPPRAATPYKLEVIAKSQQPRIAWSPQSTLHDQDPPDHAREPQKASTIVMEC